MIVKTKYQQNIAEMKRILEKYDFYHEHLTDVKYLENLISDYSFRVILIGGFSSGKSALLNRLTGRNLFKEDQGPETAVPAEISYADQEAASVVFDDGRVESFSVEGLTANPPQATSFLSININCPFLKNRPELILVDFPGFDSKIEEHNKAISNYLHKGSAFILLVPAQNGTLTESDRQFVKEAMQYPQGLACFISQSDLVLQDDLEQVQHGVRQSILSLYGDIVPVDTISIKEDVEPHFEDKISKAVDRFNPQDLFERALNVPFTAALDKASNTLLRYIEAHNLDLREIETEIVEATARKQHLEKEFEKKRKELDREYQNKIIPDILDKAESILHNNLDMLAHAAISGGEVFASNVQSLLRPVLNAVPGQIHANLRNVVEHMNINIQQKDPEAEENFKKSLLSMVDAIASLPVQNKKKDATTVQAGNALAGIIALEGSKLLSTTAAKATAGTALAGVGGAVGTFLVNPIVGVMLGLAPAIINLFFSAKAAQQPDPQEQARAQVEIQIPLILNALQAQIEPAILEIRDMMLAEIQERINENIAAETNALEAARQKKQQQEADYAQSIADIQKDIDALQQLRLG